MAGECIVKVPKYSVYDDYDFIGFSFNGYHCIEDLNIIRVNGGSMYSENLTPQIQEKSGQHPGVEGAYLLGVQHRQRVFDVNIAFDSLTDEQLYKLKEVFAGKEMGELWFDEYPYKVWDAKVTGQPMLKVIPFGDDEGPTIYKGEGVIQFTAYYPYAHTPDYIQGESGEKMDGRLLSSYYEFNNIQQWGDASDLWEELHGTAGDDAKLDIRGEAPTWFETVRTVPDMGIQKDGKTIYSVSFELEEDQTAMNTIWNSKTGLVIYNNKPINYQGRGFGQLEPGEYTLSNALPHDFKYHFWYY